MAHIEVSEIMTIKPVTVEEGSSVMESAKLMKTYRVSSVIIMSKNELVGILTVDDVVRLGVATGMNLEKTLVDDIMTRDVVTLTPGEDISEVINIFTEYGIRQVPVLDDKKNMVGFVTLKDVLRFEPAMLDIAIGGLRLEEENRQRSLQKLADGEQLIDEDDEDLFE